MLFLITGQPGNGKTLFALGKVEEFRAEESKLGRVREVYQSGIPGLTLDWKPLDDPKHWPALPDGSIVVIDECQRVFPPRKQGAEVPPWVREFETHRHRGFDVFLITQHPQLLDIAVRKLVGRHFHLRRTFGQENATLLQWEEATDPNDRTARGRALTSRFTFPKERYSWYKSSEIHTVQKKLPVKPFAILAACVVGIVGLAWFAVDRLMGMGEPEGLSTVSDIVDTVTLDKKTPGVTGEALQPAIPHWPWSAPFYAAHASVQSVPRITGCMSHRIGSSFVCKCHNGQGDANVSQEVCREFMAGRVFDPIREFVDVKRENVARLESAAAANSQSGSGQAAPSAGQPVTYSETRAGS